MSLTNYIHFFNFYRVHSLKVLPIKIHLDQNYFAGSRSDQISGLNCRQKMNFKTYFFKFFKICVNLSLRFFFKYLSEFLSLCSIQENQCVFFRISLCIIITCPPPRPVVFLMVCTVLNNILYWIVPGRTLKYVFLF